MIHHLRIYIGCLALFDGERGSSNLTPSCALGPTRPASSTSKTLVEKKRLAAMLHWLLLMLAQSLGICKGSRPIRFSLQWENAKPDLNSTHAHLVWPTKI